MLIITKINFLRNKGNTFKTQMKLILKSLIPFYDGELFSLLVINKNLSSSIRFNWNNNSENVNLYI